MKRTLLAIAMTVLATTAFGQMCEKLTPADAAVLTKANLQARYCECVKIVDQRLAWLEARGRGMPYDAVGVQTVAYIDAQLSASQLYKERFGEYSAECKK